MSETLPDSQNTLTPQANAGTIRTAQKDFVSIKLDEDINFFDLGNRAIDTKIIDTFAFYVKNTERFSSVALDFSNYSPEEKKEIVSQLRQIIIQEQGEYVKNKATLEEMLLEEYDFERIGKKKMQKAVSKITSKTVLHGLMKTQKERLKFLNNQSITEFDLNKEENLLLEEILQGYDADNFTADQTNAVHKMQTQLGSLENSDYFSLLSIFTEKDQIKLLKYFKKSFSMKMLIDNKIITEIEAKNLISSRFKKEYPKVTQTEIDSAFNEVSDFGDIYIEPNELTNENYKSLFEKRAVLEKVFDEINEYRIGQKIDIEDELFDWMELDNDGNIHNNFVSFLQHPAQKHQLTDEILSSVGNFQEGGYIETDTNQSEGGNKSYYYISAVDLGATLAGKAVKLKNLSGPDGAVKKITDAPAKVYSYKEIFKLLKSSSEQVNTRVKFLSSGEYKGLNLTETDPDYSIGTAQELKRKLLALEGQDRELHGVPITGMGFMDEIEGHQVFRSFTHADDNTNTLTFAHSGQKILYSDFFYAFKEGGKYELEKKATSFSEAVTSDSGSKVLGGLVMHSSGDKLVPKDKKDDSKAEGVKYFSNDNKAIQITSINDSEIEFTFGSIKKENKGKNGEKVVKKFTGKYSFDDWNQFINEIEKYNLKAEISEKDSIIKNDENKNAKSLEENGNIFGFIANAMSISQIAMGLEMVPNALKEHFERGDKLKAARLAQSLGFVLPDGAQHKLTSNTEGETKKLITELVDELKGRAASYEYVLKNILEKKGAQMWEIYAGMTYMIEKTGNLKAKNSKKYIGGYPWYEKLGGKVGDAFFEKEKAYALKTDGSGLKPGDARNFTEEKLVENFLKEPHMKAKLFERAGKDFGKSITKGVQEEIEDGEHKTGDENTITDKVGYFVGVLKNNEHANAVGSLKKLLSKNTSNKEMNMAPFILTASGIVSEFDTRLINQVLGLSMSTAYGYMFFSLTPERNKIFNDSIYQFLHDTGDIKGAAKFSTITNQSDYGKRATDLSDFWKEYGDTLLPFISLQNGYAQAQSLKGKEPYTGFFQTTEAIYTDGEYEIAKDQLDAGNYKDSALAPVGGKIKDININNAGGFYDSKARKVADLYIGYLAGIRSEASLDNTEKKQIFDSILKPLNERCLYAIGSYGDKEQMKRSELYKTLGKQGIIIQLLEYENLNERDFLDVAFAKFMNHQPVIEKKKEIDNESDRNSDQIEDILQGKKSIVEGPGTMNNRLGTDVAREFEETMEDDFM